MWRSMPGPWFSAIQARPATIVAIPIGTLMKKIQCQLSSCVIAPPAIRPIEAPAEIVSV